MSWPSNHPFCFKQPVTFFGSRVVIFRSSILDLTANDSFPKRSFGLNSCMAASTSWLVMVTPRFARQTRHRIVGKESNFPFSKKNKENTPPKRKSCWKSARWFNSWPFFISGSLEVTNQALKGSRFSPYQKGSPSRSAVYFPLGTTPNSADTFRSSWIGGDRCDGFFSCGNCRCSSKTFRKKRCMKRNHTFYLDNLQKHPAQDTFWHIYNVYVNITCVFI